MDLSGCQCLTDAGIASLARCCPGLRAIDVSSGFELTDEAFSALAACRDLRAVNACGCDRLTDTGLCALVRGTRCVSMSSVTSAVSGPNMKLSHAFLLRNKVRLQTELHAKAAGIHCLVGLARSKQDTISRC